jgi:hypothetical protein
MNSFLRKTTAALTVPLAAAWLALSAQAKTPAIYTVAKVDVSAEADNAVAAKEKALAQAQQIALRRLLKRLTAWNAYGKLPVLSDDMVERMVDGFAVRRESNSATRYIATLDFTFEPNAVRDILNRFALPYTDQQSGEALLIPIMIEGGAERPGTENPWFEAFANVDTEHALTPMKLEPPRPNLSASMVSGLSEASHALFETLTYQYRSENLILAIAEVNPQASRLRLRLVGRDGVGTFTLDREFSIYDRDIQSTADFAASIATKVVEGRWKTARLASQGVYDGGSAEVETVPLTAQFSGLKAWQAMRQRLEQIPGVQALQINGLNARGANVTIDFPGGVSRLAQAAQSQGLAVEERGGVWVIFAR